MIDHILLRMKLLFLSKAPITKHRFIDLQKLGDTPLINLSNVDVYTLTMPMKKDPTPYGFALKAQEKAKIFENPEDFVFYFCAETMEIMRYWVLCLRQVKVRIESLTPLA